MLTSKELFEVFDQFGGVRDLNGSYSFVILAFKFGNV